MTGSKLHNFVSLTFLAGKPTILNKIERLFKMI